MQRFQNLEMPQGRDVEAQEIGNLVTRERSEVRHVAPEMLRQIMQHRACRAYGRRFVLQPESVQRSHLEMLAHRELRRLRGENPILIPAHDRERALEQL